MTTITPSMIKELRERTGIGMGKCKEALVESNSCSANGCKSSGGETESTGHTEQYQHGVVSQEAT